MRHASRKILIRQSAWFLLLVPLSLGSPPRARSADAPPARPTPSPVATQATGTASPEAPAERKDQGQDGKKPDVIYVPTPQKVVDKMLELAEVKKGDVLYDLGCGDGRIVVTAAKKYGIKAVGFDVDPKRIEEARANVRQNGVEDLVTIRRADIFEADLRGASVVTLYLLPELNVRLMPQLQQLKDGSRIVSHDFDMRGAKPRKVVELPDGEEEENHSIFLWVVPWEKEDR
jgi:SAM-dependent methyltransferase